MALDAPKMRRRMDLGFALETTTGTAATVAATDAVTRIFNGQIDFNVEEIAREQQGAKLSPILQGLGARAAKVEFETELNGGGSGIPIWTRLLQGCGYANTAGAFAPVTGQAQTLTFVQIISGVKKTAVGCAGTGVLTCKRGQAATWKWSFDGVADAIADASMWAPSYINTVAPRVGSATFTIGGTSFIVDQVTIDLGTVVYLREDIHAVDSNAEPTGYRAAFITDRKPKISFNPETASIATRDWPGIFRASTTAAMNLVIGSATGNTWTIAAPALQIMTHPKDGDRQGLYTQELQFMAVGSTGDDELTFTLS